MREVALQARLRDDTLIVDVVVTVRADARGHPVEPALRADEEVDKIMGPADMELEKGAKLPEGRVIARVNGEFQYVETDKIQYLDVAPAQIVGVSAALIPFLEHDDANRALMGSNMQRQAVPLIRTEPPIVATGMERWVAENSDMLVRAKEAGTVKRATATEIIVGDQIYRLRKYYGLNERTCLNQRPVVREGDKVARGQVIADGPSMKVGELALGRNVTVAFMPWDGYNFEDAIIVSERLVREDYYTSIHIEEFEVEIRETKLGKEEFTRDIPNVSEKMLKNLGEDGVIRPGTRVKPGDILVGKVAPKSKSELTPEEKLLHAIFGRAGEDVKNESLEVPSGVDGIVIDTRKFSRKTNLSPTEKKKIREETKEIERTLYKQMNDLIERANEELKEILGRPPVKGFEYGPRGSVKDLRSLKEKYDLAGVEIKGKRQQEETAEVLRAMFSQVEQLEKNCREFGIQLYGLGSDQQGIVHVIGPELGITQPGKTIVCGDSHTSTHGAFGALAFGIGTTEVGYVLATQCLLQRKARNLEIAVNGTLKQGVTAKDVILYIISKIGTAGGTGGREPGAAGLVHALRSRRRRHPVERRAADLVPAGRSGQRRPRLLPVGQEQLGAAHRGRLGAPRRGRHARVAHRARQDGRARRVLEGLRPHRPGAGAELRLGFRVRHVDDDQQSVRRAVRDESGRAVLERHGDAADNAGSATGRLPSDAAARGGHHHDLDRRHDRDTVGAHGECDRRPRAARQLRDRGGLCGPLRP